MDNPQLAVSVLDLAFGDDRAIEDQEKVERDALECLGHPKRPQVQDKASGGMSSHCSSGARPVPSQGNVGISSE